MVVGASGSLDAPAIAASLAAHAPVMLMLTGMQGAGKSTFCADLAARGAPFTVICQVWNNC